MEKFSADLAYKSEVMREYVQYVPIVKPPDYGNTKFMRLPDMVSLRPPRYYACAQDWQRVVNYNDVHDGRLPEHKAWPPVQDEQRGFPAHVGPRSDLHPKLYRGPRTDEEVEQVGKQIRGLVRKEKLMPQYVRPTVNQATWTQWQARPYEQLERPADRNPVWMKSYQHAIHKSVDFTCRLHS
nr:hypothetical protein BaRGS_022502 [Batillaria attramentaria]